MDWHPECLWKPQARLEAGFLFIRFIKVTPMEAEFAAAEPGVQGRAAVKLKAFFPPPELGESKVYD